MTNTQQTERGTWELTEEEFAELDREMATRVEKPRRKKLRPIWEE